MIGVVDRNIICFYYIRSENRRSFILIMGLIDAAVKLPERTIDISNQGGAVNPIVLEKARFALHRNELFHCLSLANNVLNDDCISTLSALIKDRNYVTKYDLTNCRINDKQLTLHLIPALLLKKRVSRLVLDKNDLTDECIDSICNLIIETNLAELSLVGIHLTAVAGEKLLEAVERSPIVTVCQLPYSVGFKILDKIAALLKRNKTKFSQLNDKQAGPAPEFKSSPDEWNYQDENMLHTYRSKKRRRQALTMNEGGGGGTMNTTDISQEHMGVFALPQITAKPYQRKPGTQKINGFLVGGGAHGKLDVMHSRSMINSWADPAVKNTLVSLHMLSERSDLHRRHHKIIRSQTKLANGLDPESIQNAREARNLPAVRPTNEATLIRD